ncbi:nocardicin N-oxygenase [Actinoplanes octamycinicus]|uniref:Nocardicin N-oxygenase n=1 Tax=Actinoplanes octamycinicus TaxID=135948 RepID=A0A7W7H462_9ACTN|nr:cytochrome P450 [Actinoplanes octamycinicus]MBB4743347.1 nocardicin N-oxygenase [Actinoplanes octamycinicus]GIE61863.1 cytochrome P450 [Actinoplanes octamycinicus]
MTDDVAVAFPFIRQSPIEPPDDYQRLRDARVVQVRMSTGAPAYLVGRYEDVRMVLTDPRFSSDLHRPGVPQPSPFPPDDSMHHTDAPEHTRLRRLVSAGFTPRRVEQMRPRIQQLADELIDRMVLAGEPADLNAAFAHPLPITVICELLGVPLSDRDAFVGWAGTLVALAEVPVDTIVAAYMSLRGYLTDLTKAKRANPGDDLLSALVQAHDGGDRLSESELVSMATLLLIAGYETTIHQIGSCVVMLLEHPEQLAALRRDESLLGPAMEELMRFQGPGDGAAYRVTLEEVRIGDTVIPANSGVLAAIGAANRDEREFTDPAALDIRRRNLAHLTLGQGMHYCLGASLGRLELEIAVGTLLRRLPQLRLAVPATELVWLPNRLLSGYAEIPVSWSAP